jgi:hypothetical protein
MLHFKILVPAMSCGTVRENNNILDEKQIFLEVKLSL